MIYIINVFLLLIGMIYSKSKKVAFIICVFIASVFVFNTKNADLDAYRLIYSGDTSIVTEPFFLFFNRLFREFGMSFEIFRGVIAITGVSCIYIFTCMYSPYPALVMALYTLYPMTVDVVQFRFFIAYTIVLLAVHFMIQYQKCSKLRYIVLFILLVLAASGFHYSAFLYLIMSLLFLDIDKHKYLYLLFIPLSIIILLSMLHRLGPYIGIIIGADKLNRWLGSFSGFRFSTFLRIALSKGELIFFTAFVSKITKNNQYYAACNPLNNSRALPYHSINENNSLYDMRTDKVLFIVCIYIYIYSILEITVSGQYERISRLGLILGAILATRHLLYLKWRDRAIFKVVFVLMYFFYFLLMMFNMRSQDGVTFFDLVYRDVLNNIKFLQ